LTDWYTPYPGDALAPGDEIAPPPRINHMYVAHSHKMAVACWRYWGLVHSPMELTYYRVEATNVYGPEPKPVDELPGLFLCHRAKVIEKVSDGSLVPEGERYSDDDLWRFVQPTRWPHGAPLYDSNSGITNPPPLRPVTSLDRPALEPQALGGLRFWLPFRIKALLESQSMYRFGDGWPFWDWLPVGGEVVPPPGP
jgi:hypothetical protein